MKSSEPDLPESHKMDFLANLPLLPPRDTAALPDVQSPIFHNPYSEDQMPVRPVCPFPKKTVPALISLPDGMKASGHI